MTPLPSIAPAPLAEQGALDIAATLAVAADRLEDMILEADWHREAWEARLDRQREDYWARRDREEGL